MGKILTRVTFLDVDTSKYNLLRFALWAEDNNIPVTNSYPPLFRTCCEESLGTAYAVNGEKMMDLVLTPLGIDSEEVHDRLVNHTALKKPRQSNVVRCRYGTLMTVLDGCGMVVEGSKAVSVFLTHVISGQFKFKPNPNIRRRRRAVARGQ